MMGFNLIKLSATLCILASSVYAAATGSSLNVLEPFGDVVRPSHVLDYMTTYHNVTPIQTYSLEDGLSLTVYHLDTSYYDTVADLLRQDGNTTELVPWHPHLQPRLDSLQIYCYGSGSWARDITISAVLGAACSAFTYGSAKLGIKQIVEITGVLNEAGDTMKLVFSFLETALSFATASTCSGLLTHIITDACQVCQGPEVLSLPLAKRI